MVITDDESIIHTIRIILKDYFVERVSPKEAIIKISERNPFLVIIDTFLPEIDVCELIDKITEEKRELLIVPLISFYDKKAREILQKNIFYVVEKQFLYEKIRHVVERAEKWMKSVDKIEGVIKQKEEGFIIEKEDIKNNFFQMIFQEIAENFSDIKKMCYEILKVLRKFFHFGSMAILLNEKGTFKVYASFGIDENILKEIKIDFESPVIKWFLKENKILNLKEKYVDFELRNFASIFNSSIIIPLKTFSGKFTGIIMIGEKIINDEIKIEEISILSLLSDYLAIVFDNFFLYNEIKLQKEYQETLFKNLSAGIIGVDREGRINLLNEYGEKILRVKYDEIKGEKIEKAGSQIADFIRRTLMSGETVSRKEFEFIPTKAILGISTNPIKDEKGNITGAVGIFQDLTYIKEIEKKEKEIERDKYWGNMASRLSHELKNPLVAINTFAQMLPQMYGDEEFRTKFSNIVFQEIKKINEIIDRINKIADTIELKKSLVDLNEFINEISKGIEIFKKYEVIPKVNIEIDFIKMKEAFDYIFEFIKEDILEKGKVYLNIFEKDNFINILISEDGKNIKIEKKEDIFMPFNPNLKTPFSVGLILAKKIIESHNGKIEFEITPEEKTFIINLPLK
jgi:PAS domain S-box-containing protein